MAPPTKVDLPYRPRRSWKAPLLSEALEYQELNDNEFRLLQVEGFDRQGTLQSRLQTVSRGQCDGYTAISYTWNGEDRVWYDKYDMSLKPIWIDGRLVQIADKVANTLCLAFHHERRRVWIDTICINQSDAAEKGHQVARMGELYSGATDVLCFLNNPSRRTDAILEKIRLCPGTLPSKYSLKDDQEAHLLKTDDYWRRAWTLQEMRLAETPFICCGWTIIPLANFMEFCSILDGVQPDFTDLPRIACYYIPRGLHYLWTGNIREEAWDSRMHITMPEDFLDVLDQCRGSYACRDSRDLLYSRLALSPESSTMVPYPDYTVGVEELYKSFAANYIIQRKSLKIITFATQTSMSVPTWVPDWTSKASDWGPYDLRRSKAEPLIDKLCWEQKDLPRVSHCRSEVTVQGRILKRIKRRSLSAMALSALTQAATSRGAHAPSELPRHGDSVCVLKDCPSLVFLRPVDDHYIVVGRNPVSHGDHFRITSYDLSSKEFEFALEEVRTIPEVVFQIR